MSPLVHLFLCDLVRVVKFRELSPNYLVFLKSRSGKPWKFPEFCSPSPMLVRVLFVNSQEDSVPDMALFVPVSPSSGLLCHLDDACVSNPCNEGAVCDTNPLNGRAICTCPAGFVGGACNQDMDECSIGKMAYYLAPPSALCWSYLTWPRPICTVCERVH